MKHKLDFELFSKDINNFYKNDPQIQDLKQKIINCYSDAINLKYPEHNLLPSWKAAFSPLRILEIKLQFLLRQSLKTFEVFTETIRDSGNQPIDDKFI